MVAWKEYDRFEVIDINSWSQNREKEGWEILQFFNEDNLSSYNNNQTISGTIDTKAVSLSIPMSTTNRYTNHKFLIGQNKTYDVLFKKVT